MTSALRFAPTLFFHAFLWGAVALLLSLAPPGQPSPLPTVFWLKQAGVLALLLGVYAVNTQWAVPQLLYGQRVAAYLALSVLLLLGVLLGHEGLSLSLRVRPAMGQARRAAELADPEAMKTLGPPPAKRPGLVQPGVLFSALLVLGLGTGRVAVARTRRDHDAHQELRQTQLQTEMALLKAQINPHFFFNTLNNIHALTVRDGRAAQTAIHRLSRMMRYVLYDTSANTTLLSQELLFVQDYVDLMQLRLTNTVAVTFERPAPLLDVLLAPMLLLPFVENAFKHGVSTDAPSRIGIAVSQPDAHTLVLDVRNTRHPAPSPALADSGGIGLDNTRRRLELLYPGRFTLTVTEHTPDNEFRAHLLLDLS